MGHTNLGQLREGNKFTIPLRSSEPKGCQYLLFAGFCEKATFFLRRPGISMLTLALSSGLTSKCCYKWAQFSLNSGWFSPALLFIINHNGRVSWVWKPENYNAGRGKVPWYPLKWRRLSQNQNGLRRIQAMHSQHQIPLRLPCHACRTWIEECISTREALRTACKACWSQRWWSCQRAKIVSASLLLVFGQYSSE